MVVKHYAPGGNKGRKAISKVHKVVDLGVIML